MTDSVVIQLIPKYLQPFEWAKKEWREGIREMAGQKENNPRIIWYHSLTTLKATTDETPWCSSFMCAAAFSAGLPSTRSAAAKSWLEYGEKGDGSEGDIAVFKRKGGHHVAFIYKRLNASDKLVHVLGGNQGNSVSVATYCASDLLAIRRFKG